MTNVIVDVKNYIIWKNWKKLFYQNKREHKLGGGGGGGWRVVGGGGLVKGCVVVAEK